MKKTSKFYLSDFFEVIPGRGLTSSEYVEGLTPYISESSKNNGVRFFINLKQILSDFNIQENSLTISSKTGRVFYHKYKHCVGQQVHSLKPLDKYSEFFTENVFLYFINVIEKQTIVKASFGYQLSSKKLPYISINVPTINGIVDWEKMEEEIEDIKIGKEMEIDIEPLLYEDVELDWRLVKFSDVFSSKEFYSSRGIDEVDLKKLETDPSSNRVPYITRTASNNGIKSHFRLKDQSLVEKGNCIIIGLDTQTCFYQPHPFLTGQNIHILRLNELTKYSGIILAAILEQSISKFSWGSNGATLTRIRRMKFMIPIKEDQVDIEGLEQYVKTLEFSKEL